MEFSAGTFVLLILQGLYGYSLGLRKGRELAAAEFRADPAAKDSGERQLDQLGAVAPEPARDEPPKAAR